MHKALALSVFLLWQMSALAVELPAPVASASGAGSGVEPASSKPALRIDRVLVRDRPWFERFIRSPETPEAVRQRDAGCRDKADFTPCNPTLVGTGEVELVVPRADYDLMAAEEKKAGGLVLYINGVPLPTDAKRIGIEHRGADTHLSFRIEQGVDTQTLWSLLYKSKGLLGNDSLRVALGWSGQGPGTTFPPVLSPEDTNAPGARIAVTSTGYVVAAAIVILGLIGGLILLGQKTDALRGGTVPPWWREAERLRTSLAAAGADQALVLSDFEPAYDASKRQATLDLAESSGVPSRCNGTVSTCRLIRPALSRVFASSSVITTPGATALTRMPRWPTRRPSCA